MGFVTIFGKSMIKNAYLPTISILLQFGGEILALLCPGDSIQILLILSQKETFGTETKLEELRRICIESPGHNRANISPPNCNKMLIFGK